MIHLNTICKTATLVFRCFQLFPKINEVSRGKNASSIDSNLCLKNDGAKNEILNDCLLTDWYVSWIVCSCEFSFSESLYFSEVDAFLNSDKSGEKYHQFVVCFFQ